MIIEFSPQKNQDVDEIQNKLDGKNIISIASGKGGVGKTWISVSVAHALALKGFKVLLVDGDLGLANTDIQLGISPQFDIGDILENNTPIRSAIFHHETLNIDLICGRSGSLTLANLDQHNLQVFCDDLKIIAHHYDYVFIDLGSGLRENILSLAKIAGQAVVVSTDSPTALVDAYSFIKAFKNFNPNTQIKILINMANTKKDGERTYHTLLKACQSFLNSAPSLSGIIHQDSHVKEAINAQDSILTLFPTCQASQDILNLNFT